MNNPAENRRKIAQGLSGPNPTKDEHWAKMIRDSDDQRFAEAHGLKVKMGKRDEQQHMVNKKEL